MSFKKSALTHGERRLDSFRDYDRAPASYMPHKGFCGCGVETSDMLTVGPPGHPENGWTCKACQELRLQFEMRKADPGRI